MTRLPTLILTLSLLSSSLALAQQPNPLPLEPPDLFGNRVTVVPSAGVIPTQPIIDVIQPVQQILDSACGTVSSVGGGVSKQLAFLCTARDIVNHTVDTVEGLNQDLSSFANRAAGGLLDSTASAFGGAFGLDTVNAGMTNLRRIVTGATGQARAALDATLEGMFQRSVRNLFAKDPQRPPSDPRNLGALARVMYPEAAVAAVQNEARQRDLLSVQGNAAITLNDARKDAAALAANRSATDLNALVNTPVTGMAAGLEARVGAAVSSREAIQRMTEGIADVMSVMATANSQVAANIASLAAQNVYTLQQLSSLVEIESQRELAQLEAAQRSADAAMLNAWEEAQAMHAIAASASRGFYAIGNDAPKGLAVQP